MSVDASDLRVRSYTRHRKRDERFMYKEVYDFAKLRQGFYDAKHGKFHNPAENKFEIRLLEALVILSDKIREKTYVPDKTTSFKVYSPKVRDVETNSFKDKVVLHSLCDNVLYPAIQPSFIYDNYASQNGKGRAFGLDRLAGFMRHYFFSRKSKHEQELRAAGLPLIKVEDGHYADGWVLKCDIRKYFANIKHDLVKDVVKRYITDEDTLWLLDTVIDQVKDPGLPIGFQTRPLLSLLLLNDFDHMVKERLHIRYYGRYADDFYLIHKDKDYLRYCLKEIRKYLAEYGLELNEKTQIFPLKNGIDFLGFHTYITDTGKVVRKIRKRSKDNTRRKLKKMKKKLDAGQITMDKIDEFYTSWRSYAAGGDTYHLLQKMGAIYNSLFNQTETGGETNVLY